MKIKAKLKSRGGFSLAETLLAILILMLVSVIMANGIPVARNVYNKVIIGANAQTLLSTTVSALRNELGTAQDVDVKSVTVTNAGASATYDNIYYRKPNPVGAGGYYAAISPNKGAMTAISADTIDAPDADPEMDGVQQLDYITQDGSNWKAILRSGEAKRPSHYLVSTAAANKDLIVTYSSASVDKANGYITISGITVTHKGAELARLDQLIIRYSPISA